jgi:hypothetical protein
MAESQKSYILAEIWCAISEYGVMAPPSFTNRPYQFPKIHRQYLPWPIFDNTGLYSVKDFGAKETLLKWHNNDTVKKWKLHELHIKGIFGFERACKGFAPRYFPVISRSNSLYTSLCDISHIPIYRVSHLDYGLSTSYCFITA